MSDSFHWHTCLHEAGHAVAGVVLGGRVRIVVASANGGHCIVDQLEGCTRAFMVAAGPAAEELLADVPAPQVSPSAPDVTPAVELPDSHDVHAEADSLVAACYASTGLSDDEALAAWAIAGREDDPDCWAGRIYWAREIARQIVADHRDRIVQVATDLFQRGILPARYFEKGTT